MSENIKRILCRTAAAAAVNVDISQTKPSRFVRPYFEMNGFSVAQNSIIVNARKREALPWSICARADAVPAFFAHSAKKHANCVRKEVRSTSLVKYPVQSANRTGYLRGGYADDKKSRSICAHCAQRKKTRKLRAVCALISDKKKCGALPWSNTPCSLRTARSICVVGTLMIKISINLRAVCALISDKKKCGALPWSNTRAVSELHGVFARWVR